MKKALFIEILMLIGLSCTLSSQAVPTTSTKPTIESPLMAIQPPLATTDAPIATPANSLLQLVPIFIHSSESGGWKFYVVNFALENQSDQWLPVAVDTGKGIVETQEGFNYDAEPIRYSDMTPLLHGEPIAIPPDFRIAGSTDDYNGFENALQLVFNAAETAYPLQVNFGNYGMINLTNIPTSGASLSESISLLVQNGSYTFPTNKPRTSYKNMGDTVEIPNQARITFLQAYRSQYGIFDGVTIDVQFQNLNAGYDTTINAGCYMIDGMGFIRWNKEDTRFYAGPGQTNTTKIGFYLWNPSKAFYGDNSLDSATLDLLRHNSKLICRGDFEAIFNLDF